jgi:biopolymer transport protein ExbB
MDVRTIHARFIFPKVSMLNLKELFIKGGPIMWPILVCSLLALTVVIERIIFIVVEKLRRQPKVVDAMLDAVEQSDPNRAVQIAAGSKDFVVRTLASALMHRREKSISSAMLRSAEQELARYNRGLSILDTIITLAPLLGLLGTVTGMMSSFGMLGGTELAAPTAITGGIAEALIATAFGLGVAITALIPFNYLHAQLEHARRQIQDAAAHVEIHIEHFTQNEIAQP